MFVADRVGVELAPREKGLPFMGPAVMVLGLGLLAVLLSAQSLTARIEGGSLLGAILSPSGMGELVVHFSWLPRLLVSWLCGAALGLAGVLMQQVLRNPLASPTTLGVSAGAHLALVAATLAVPGLAGLGREAVALAGSGVAAALVFSLAWNKGLAPLAVVLAGLVVSLYFGALGAALVLFNQSYLAGLFIWGAGALSQQDWSVVLRLGPLVVASGVAAALMVRPLALLDLDEAGARGLGVPLVGLRLAALAVSVVLAAAVVSAVGVVGFVGLAAPALATLAGARTFGARLVWGPLIGAVLLWFADQLVQVLAGLYGDLVPTGALTALFGSPLLLWLLPRLKRDVRPPRMAAPVREPRARHPVGALIAMVAALGVLVLPALLLSHDAAGWSLDLSGALLEWRWPRVLAALAAGALLAMAGTITQRVTGNPMASPEVLGLTSGAALALIVVVMALPGADRATEIAAGAAGAFLTTVGLLWLTRRAAFAPDSILLAGIALGALFDALVVAVTASGDPRAVTLLAWLAGSTARVGSSEALTGLVAVVALGAAAVPFARWLDLLPLGAVTAGAVGVDVKRARLLLLVLTALMTATATLIVGPLTFVGLLAPHLARLAGFPRALPHLLAAALVGALVMVGADLLGRTLIYPRQIPTGLLATLIGAPYLLWRLRRL
ncbi:Fe(3+)-hydroxamate ABC transporter permease FhuB [Xanthobacter agilis]|uniref:Fe(3+)-hydroxamate ABC transporter permease FhuB n=1 Tax=Xanthobacter agilis TaxID=47492 RepID=UPI003522A821